MTHFVPVTLCVMQKTHVNQQPYGMTHNVTGTKCVIKHPLALLPFPYTLGWTSVNFTLWSYHLPFLPISAMSNSWSMTGTGRSKALTVCL